MVRTASRRDAAGMLRLVRESGVLDVNSCYAYLLMCEHFSDTCLVAEPATGGAPRGLAGFVTAYRPPCRPGVLFVWQIGVAPWAQTRGLGKQLLRRLVQSPSCQDCDFLEATVAPSNRASQSLFASFAQEVGAELRRDGGFLAIDFDDAPGGGHEAEPLYRIGPLRRDRPDPKES